VVSLAFGGAGFLGPAIGGWSYTRSKDFVFAILIVEILLIVGFSVYMFYSWTIARNGIHPIKDSRETNILGVKQIRN
jgi:predicted MFS family arabinose efflux permease